jgi:uncharacterized protein YbbK (DUF523 family)
MNDNPGKAAVGISSCLLGEQVRYDGGHKYDRLINTQLAGLFEFRPCCPEVAIGLGIPREPIQLVRTDLGIHVKGVNNPNIDVTRRLEAYGNSLAREFADICGYIFKARSPSCGIEGVATWTAQGNQIESDGTGAFAAALLSAHPGLPVTDEARLQDPVMRKHFIECVFTRYRKHHPAAP